MDKAIILILVNLHVTTSVEQYWNVIILNGLNIETQLYTIGGESHMQNASFDLASYRAKAVWLNHTAYYIDSIVKIFNPFNNETSVGPAMNIPPSGGHAATVVDDRIIFCGGYSDTNYDALMSECEQFTQE